MKYKYLLFDCDDTVLDFGASERIAIQKLFSKYGLSVSDAMIYEYIQINEKYWLMYEKVIMSRDEILVKRFEEFFSKYGVKEDCTKVNYEYLTLLTENVVVIDGIENVLEKLSRTYELYIITNGVKWTQEKRFAHTSVKGFFKDFFISETIGIQKPEKGFFDYVIKSIGDDDLSKYLVIGDSISSDIVGGKKYGIDTLWYNPKGKQSDVLPTMTIKRVEEYLDILS